MNRDEQVLSEIRTAFGNDVPKRLGVAVSGGGDSVALLHALARCWSGHQVRLFSATVDHGLRREAESEAQQVAVLAGHLGVTHSTLRWHGWNGKGNLQDRARRARYALLTDWAHKNSLPVLALGHTADDQAETVLMRLSRSAGVDGLSGIPKRRCQNGILLIRPALNLARATLRDYLERNGLEWAEDPSNENEAFDRIKARRALEHLAPMGISAGRLAAVARHMGQAREALEEFARRAASDCAELDAGDVLIDLRAMRTLPEEIARRVLAGAISWVGDPSDYPPRGASLVETLAALHDGKAATLGGCMVVTDRGVARIAREYASIRDQVCMPGETWDHRWRLKGPNADGCAIRALGEEGLKECSDWRQTGRPRTALAATPAVWRGEVLEAAPLAGFPNGWRAEFVRDRREFLASFLSH